MPTYSYEAITSSGKKLTGTIEAGNVNEAKSKIASEGNIPLKVTAGGRFAKAAKAAKGSDDSKGLEGLKGLKGLGDIALFGSVKPEELILFSKQFKTMFQSGISIIDLLEILNEQVENPMLRKACGQISEDLRRGVGLSEAFGRHPKIFDPLYCSLMLAGEKSGALAEIMERLIYIIEHENKVKKDLKSAMSYPIMVCCALVGAFVIMLTVVLPKFVNLFKSQNIELPMPTQICLAIEHYTSLYWPIILGGCAALVVIMSLFGRTPAGKLFFSRLLLKMPLLGPVFTKSAMSRFASIFAILQASGIAVLECMDILTGTIGSYALSKELDDLKIDMQEGRGISEPLRKSSYFPPMIINMISIGERTGKLDDMLREIAIHYDYEVDYALGKMSSMIGPLLVAGLTGVVGFFAMAIFLPLAEITQKSLGGM